MTTFVIEGRPPFDGRYPFDLGREFTTREWGWIKRLSGYLPLDIEAGFAGGDSELMLVLTVIGMHRLGNVQAVDVPRVFDELADAQFGVAIRLEADAVEAGGPDDPTLGSTPESFEPRQPYSGPDSPNGSTGPSATDPKPTGTPVLDSSASASKPWAI